MWIIRVDRKGKVKICSHPNFLASNLHPAMMVQCVIHDTLVSYLDPMTRESHLMWGRGTGSIICPTCYWVNSSNTQLPDGGSEIRWIRHYSSSLGEEEAVVDFSDPPNGEKAMRVCKQTYTEARSDVDEFRNPVYLATNVCVRVCHAVCRRSPLMNAPWSGCLVSHNSCQILHS